MIPSRFGVYKGGSRYTYLAKYLIKKKENKGFEPVLTSLSSSPTPSAVFLSPLTHTYVEQIDVYPMFDRYRYHIAIVFVLYTHPDGKRRRPS